MARSSMQTLYDDTDIMVWSATDFRTIEGTNRGESILCAGESKIEKSRLANERSVRAKSSKRLRLVTCDTHEEFAASMMGSVTAVVFSDTWSTANLKHQQDCPRSDTLSKIMVERVVLMWAHSVAFVVEI